MAKRGETRPWRMTYTWTGDAPVSGTNTFTSLEQATDAARVQAGRTGGVSGEQNCVAVVTHRAQPDVVRARFAGRDARTDGQPAAART